ncbi:Os01g0644500, partial [Oryza sativa Japonica Group]
ATAKEQLNGSYWSTTGCWVARRATGAGRGQATGGHGRRRWRCSRSGRRWTSPFGKPSSRAPSRRKSPG